MGGRPACTTLMLLSALWSLSPADLRAHDSVEQFVRHRYTVTVGQSHIDVHLELNFYGQLAGQERLRMDTDSDGRISFGERQAYLRELGVWVRDRLRMRVGSEHLKTVPLFHPDLDVLGNGAVASFPLTIQLSFFARTPDSLSGRLPLTIESHVLPNRPAIHLVRVQSRDGIQLSADPIEHPVSSGQHPFTFRIRTGFRDQVP